MSTQVIHAPALPLWPALRARIARIGQAIWRALEAEGRARGRRELWAMADRWHDQEPQLASELRAAARFHGAD